MTDTLTAITCGRPLAHMQSDHVAITEVHYAPGDTYPRHAHDRPYLMLVCTGGFSETTARATAELTSGGVIVVPRRDPHVDVIAATGARGLLVTLEPSFPALPARWAACQGGPVSRAMIALCRAHRAGGGAEALAVEEHLLDALDQASGTATDTGREVRAVRIAREVLEEQSEQPLRFEAIARHAGVSPAYLARAFRRFAGRTMGAYLRSVRARRAAAMLASPAHSLAEVAAAAGFADQSHLSRVFQREYGMTPRRYRQLMNRSSAFKT